MDETNTDAAVATPAKPRAPKLTLTVGDQTHSLLKYAFPVKAARFGIKVNGQDAEAACTAGRGKSYTYILFNNTSFYIPGTLSADAEVSVNFPEGYKFDDEQTARVSYYKPKGKKEPGEAGEAAAEPNVTDEGAAAGIEDLLDTAPDAKRAKRRKGA